MMDFKNTKISILLATYNSSSFLKEQIDSLQNQSCQNWTLHVRDDGSTDETLEILECFCSTDPRIFIINDNLKNLGAAKSFMELVKNVESDYYFFCDHDDVWLPDKLAITLEAIQRENDKNNNVPLVVHSDLYVVNQNLEILNDSFWRSSGIKPNVLNNKNFIQVFNFVTGCTMGFNRKARDISINFPEIIPMHDWWITMNVLLNGGEVINVEKSLIYYRQHTRNEVGARNVNFIYFLKKILNVQVSLKHHAAHIKFLKSINGHGYLKYYLIKIYYSLIRKV